LWVLGAGTIAAGDFPRALAAYRGSNADDLAGTLWQRIQIEPFNAVATGIFFLAVVHTFVTARIRHWAHEIEAEQVRRRAGAPTESGAVHVSFKGQILHFLGEVEAVFGVWAVVLAVAIGVGFGWNTMVDYVGHQSGYTEAAFVVVVMAIASSRPVLRAAEQVLGAAARIGGGTTAAWWSAILFVAPLLGSLITEPAAMTIAALLLSRRFYALQPSRSLAYATIGLLFVNVSVGGTLTHFAAPPVLMVAGPWGWDTGYMVTHFGWKAAVGMAVATAGGYLVFRRELAAMDRRREAERTTEAAVPLWITAVQMGFLGFTVLVAHTPPLFIGGFLFFLAFTQATAPHQGTLELRSPLLVGFFLAGLVVHGGLQAWWIEPVLRGLNELALFSGATVLTAFNDNAAITYLATLVPGFSDPLKHAVVAGAVTGGGLTVIANAPNPAGQSILQRHFPDGVSPLGLVLGALGPTAIMAAAFLLL
jgi:hypothetical protein